MKNRKINKEAFTLIELLAVLVILAVIALIAVPIILGIVEDARRDAFLRSTELIVSSLDLDMGLNQYETKTYTMEDGKITPELKVEIQNTKGISGSVFYGETGIAEYALHNDTWCVLKSNEMEKATVVKYKEGSCTLEDIMELPKVSIEVKKTNSKEEVVNNTWSNELVTIILKDENEKKEGNKLYYCVDTTNTCDPDKEVTTEEETPIENTGEIYIRYKIVNSIGVESNVGSYKGKVDIEKPSVSSITVAEEKNEDNTKTVTIIGQDNEGGSGVAEYCLTKEDDSSTCEWTETKQINKENGIYYVFIKDVAGNISITTTNSKIEVKVSLLYGNLKQAMENVVKNANDSVEAGDNSILKNEGDYGIRFEGSNPNNYVNFNEETWRIIGIVDGKVKIIRNDILGNIAWDSGNIKNNWSTSTLQKLLNGDYYNSTGTYANNKGIKAEYKAMIANTTWSLLGSDTSSVTKAGMYNLERNGSIYSGNPRSFTAPIGLMYPSDYGFAVKESEQCSSTQTLDTYDAAECKNNNWLFNDATQWTITPRSNSSNVAFFLWKAGILDTSMNYVLGECSVRPVLNLVSNVKITGGTGEAGSPYELSLEE